MSDMGDKLKITRKSFSFHFDNLWKRGVTKYYLPLLGVTMDRQNQSVVTKVTSKYIYQHEGRSYKLSFNLVGLSAEVWWHRSSPKQKRVEL